VEMAAGFSVGGRMYGRLWIVIELSAEFVMGRSDEIRMDTLYLRMLDLDRLLLWRVDFHI
jgi:hypothetical protein